MRTVRYSVAMSLDGYIAGPKGEYDWIVMDPEIAKGFPAQMKRFDVMLLGRKTFEATAGQGGGGGAFSGMKVIVCSSTLKPADHKGVTIAPDAAAAVRRLRQEPGKDIWLFGGGSLFRSLLDDGLVDAVEVAVIPVILGAGIPLLPSPASRASLTLVAHRTYPKTGTVWLEYKVGAKATSQARGSKRAARA
jgi:dihydrofolate reductase